MFSYIGPPFDPNTVPFIANHDKTLKNTEISKKNILTTIWGINQNVDTHTLETHLYRLKQKLYKIEPKLTFSLINHNGIYVFNSNY